MRSGLACLLLLAACASHRAGPAAVHAPANRTAVAPPAARAPRPPSLTPDTVLATIRADYLPGMRRCYRRYLKHNERARGRVIVSFTVDAKGRAREGAASGVADRVDDCIVAQLSRWTFPAPERGDARFALGLDLVQD